MKTKALVLGALPLPFEGPWVLLDETKGWRLDVTETMPGTFLEVADEADGPVSRNELNVIGELVFSGRLARIVVEQKLDTGPISVFVEEERG